MNPHAVLTAQLERRLHQPGIGALGVAVHDFAAPGRRFFFHGDRWFHAASVIKVAILLGLFRASETGVLDLEAPLHVRNRFRSIVDGSIYRINRQRDGDLECHRRVGRTMPLLDLARAMIVRSSNLATNLLLELVGLEAIRATLTAAGIDGVRVVRGVEDHVAFEHGLNNEMTAAGAAALFSLLCEGDFLQPASRRSILAILHAQEFNTMLPARLPARARVAHKTGEISTHTHDAGIVHFADRAPYVIAVFTEGGPGLGNLRAKAIAEISALVFDHLTADARAA